jgi:hypothetical protein
MKLLRSKLFPAAIFFTAFAAAAQMTNGFLPAVQNNFARWDLNHDGILSTNELDAAVADPQTKNDAAAAVAALKRASRLPKISLPPLTVENIAALAAQREPNVALMFGEGLKRISGATNRSLFADGLPKLETIHQGKLGNCFCLAPLGAMVHRDPAQVAAMFTALTNGDYCVRFGKKTVEVSPPTDAEIAMTSSNDRDGIWVNLYEKAVGTARNEDRPLAERADSPLDALARGGSAGTMLAYITGHDMVRFSFKFAKDPAFPTNDFAAKLVALREKLSAATRQNQLMTCGTIKPTTPGLTPNHAYAVLGYEADADAVELWNPHGEDFSPAGAPGAENGYATVKGVFQIPVAQFVRQFSGMAFEVVAEKVPRT